MSPVSLAILVLGVGLEAALIARALVTGITQKFPILYSYIAFVLCCEGIGALTFFFFRVHYANVMWFYWVARTLAEFGVLVGVSDSIFKPYPTIRFIGRLIVGATCVAFVLLFAIPLDWNPQPSPVVFLNLEKFSALTKGVAIFGLLASARSYRIPLGRNAGGILLGLAAYQTVSMANFAAAGQFGRTIYADILSWLAPLSFGICLIIWTFTLWNPDPVLQPRVEATGAPGLAPDRPEFQLRRFSTFVTRLLWK
jgi:hypothetical protein